MTEPLSADDVRKVAELARLKLTPEELQTYSAQLSKLLEYVDVLNEVDTEGVEPMAHAVEQVNVFRDDVVLPSLPREDALANAPRTNGRTFLVPQILDGQ